MVDYDIMCLFENLIYFWYRSFSDLFFWLMVILFFLYIIWEDLLFKFCLFLSVLDCFEFEISIFVDEWSVLKVLKFLFGNNFFFLVFWLWIVGLVVLMSILRLVVGVKGLFLYWFDEFLFVLVIFGGVIGGFWF